MKEPPSESDGTNLKFSMVEMTVYCVANTLQEGGTRTKYLGSKWLRKACGKVGVSGRREGQRRKRAHTSIIREVERDGVGDEKGQAWLARKFL